MRTRLITLATALLVTTTALALEPKIVISRLSIQRTGEKVNLSFRINIAGDLGPATRVLVIEPVLQNGRYKWSLPPVIARKRDARTRPDQTLRALRVTEGENASYSATIPFKEWMNGAKLVLEKVDAGWDDDMEVKYITAIDPVRLAPTPTPRSTPAPTPARTRETTGDRLSSRFPHVLHASAANTPARGLSIAFRPGSNRLDPELDNNWEILTDILSTIRAIEYSGDSRVTHVIVEGHTSLDDSHEQNITISWQRAAAVKEYLARHAGLPPDILRVHNAGEDWEGLRALVEQSYMPSREAVLHVIDRVPVWDHVLHTGRQKILQTLHDGLPYRYMRDYFFPRLRRAALVRIYYTNIP